MRFEHIGLRPEFPVVRIQWDDVLGDSHCGASEVADEQDEVLFHYRTIAGGPYCPNTEPTGAGVGDHYRKAA